MWNWLGETVPGFSGLPPVNALPDDGIRIEPAEQPAAPFSMEGITKGEDLADRFELLAVEWTFGTEELSAHSECLKDLAGIPCICMHRSDAQNLSLTDGDRISVELDSGAIVAELQAKDNMAAGTLVIPRHEDLDWQVMGTGRALVPKDRIRKLK